MSLSIDACESNALAQFVNDEHRRPNCYIKKVKLPEEEVARLCIFSKKKIERGSEITYDYGPTMAGFWWREVNTCVTCNSKCQKRLSVFICMTLA